VPTVRKASGIKAFQRIRMPCGGELGRVSPRHILVLGLKRIAPAVASQSCRKCMVQSVRLSRMETMTMRLALAVLAAGLAVAGAASAQDTSAPQAEPGPQAMPAPSGPPAPPAMPAPSVTPAPSIVPSPPAAPAPGRSAPDADDSRYSFHRVQDSFVRLDSRTGQVSVCGRETAGWACRAVPDERTALEEAIGRLQGDNAALKKELLARGLSLPGGVKPDAPAAKESDKGNDKPAEARPTPKMPSDAELDRVLAFIEKVWRRLVEMMVDFQRDIQRKS
jgi:hypothetical protein